MEENRMLKSVTLLLGALLGTLPLAVSTSAIAEPSIPASTVASQTIEVCDFRNIPDVVRYISPRVVEVYVTAGGYSLRRLHLSWEEFSGSPEFERIKTDYVYYFESYGIMQRGEHLTKEIWERAQQSDEFKRGNRKRIGTGWLLDEEEYVVTNRRFLGDTTQDITITFSNGDTASASIVGNLSMLDMAVLKTNRPATPLPTVEYTTDDELTVGKAVIILGTPDNEFDRGVTPRFGLITKLPKVQESVPPIFQFFHTSTTIIDGGSRDVQGGIIVDACTQGKVLGWMTSVVIDDRGGRNISAYNILAQSAIEVARRIAGGRRRHYRTYKG
jgi:S1-C subfamily serine protease